jgi:hypothetical protein
MAQVSSGAQDVELPRWQVLNAVMALLGAAILAGVLMILSGRVKTWTGVDLLGVGRRELWIFWGGTGCLGLLLTVIWGCRLITSSPLLRATPTGVWFGGGSIILWPDLKSVFESELTGMTGNGMARTVRYISFDFHRTRTVLRALVLYWLRSLSGVGDINIQIDAPRGMSSVFVARLEAMRVQAAPRSG